LSRARGNCRSSLNVLVTDEADQVAAAMADNFPTMLRRGVKLF